MTAAPLTACGQALDTHTHRPPRLPLDTIRPYVGILGVLLGSLLATLGSRVTSFGLSDLRGELHAGFDEGAWITTSFGVGQMMVGVACPYLGAVFGVRRILLLGIGLFFTASLLAPLSPNLSAYLAMQFLAGVGSGSFIPLTISFIVRSLPTRLIAYGLAVYAMNSEFSQNVGAALEGWYVEHWSIAWLNWQYCVVLPAMLACVWVGIPREPVNARLLEKLDWPGVVYAGVGFALLYAGLDQGNRLDWTRNGLIDGLFAAGGLVTAAFVIRELVVARTPFLNLRLLLRGNLLILMMLLGGFRFIILSTAYVIPTYLQTVQNFRELQVAPVLLAIALPQFALVLPLGWLLGRVDGRWVLALGALLIAIACLQATTLTSAWATYDFLPSQIIQAVGQCFALTALVVLVTQSINAADALTIGALLQTSRLFGGEIGTAFMQTFVRVREQVHSNLLGLHIDPLAGETADRLLMYRTAVGTRTADLGIAAAQATKLLTAAVAQQASVLAYIDGFAAAAAGAFGCVCARRLAASDPGRPLDFITLFARAGALDYANPGTHAAGMTRLPQAWSLPMSGEDAPQPRIAVIGGGYTGAAFVIHAVSARSGPLGIDVIEPAAAIGRGIAYSTTDPAHRINVPSAKMSLFPNDPEHLTRWLFSHGILPDPASTDAADHHFVPRYAYGDYVRDTLRETLEAAGERVRFRHHRARAEAVRRSEGGWVIALSDDGSIEADTVVICSGHAAPTPPPTVSADALRHPGFIQNPWADGAFAVIGPKDEILVVGTGLTMADVIASLDRMGHQGSVTALSRRGLLAQPHGLFLSDIDFLDGRPMPTTALELLRLARHQVRRLGPDIGWQAVVDALRFDLPRIWRALSAREQRKVARRLLPFWEVHRFRVAPQIHDLVSGERSRGRLRLAIGSFEGLQTRNGRLVAAIRPPRQDVQWRDYDHVVLCTGPGRRLETDRLMAALLADGLARPDAVALGLETDERSRVVRPDGTAWQSLIALGPLTRGSFGEMTGAPDIVQHIRSVVDTIANDGGPSSGG